MVHALGTQQVCMVQEYWEMFDKHPHLQGGFIWDWVDQGLINTAQAPSGCFCYPLSQPGLKPAYARHYMTCFCFLIPLSSARSVDPSIDRPVITWAVCDEPISCECEVTDP